MTLPQSVICHSCGLWLRDEMREQTASMPLETHSDPHDCIFALRERIETLERIALKISRMEAKDGR